MTSKQEKIELLNHMLNEAEEYGEYEPEDDGATISDLTEEEIDILFDYLVEILKRPKRIGRI